MENQTRCFFRADYNKNILWNNHVKSSQLWVSLFEFGHVHYRISKYKKEWQTV